MFLPYLKSSVIQFNEQTHGNMNLYVLYNNETKYYTYMTFLFISKCFNITRKPAFAHFGEDEKKPFDAIYDLYKVNQFHCLLCVAKNCDWSRKITPQSNLTPASLLVKLKLTGKAELRNLQTLKKMLEKSSQFLSTEQPCEPKSLDVALKIAGCEKIPSENSWLRST